jgi:raffinose/stachyose/melibiose transport system substrate-binding protein
MFRRRSIIRTAAAAVGVLLATGTLAACSSGGSADTGSSGGKVTISYLTQNDSVSVASAHKYISAFEKANPNITVKLDTQPAGTQGDNLTKTKLSTGDMDDVFFYNDGSLLQALDPDQQLVDLSDQSWVKGLTSDFKKVVAGSKGTGVYGAPVGTSFAGGVLYNKKVYDKLGLSVPTTWDEFMANSKKIQSSDPSVTPILQTFGDDWTAQLFVLGDFANVAAQDPNWATKYTAGKEKYADPPALEGFQHQQETFQAGLYNKDYASLTNIQGLKELADGTAAQYPMLSNSLATIVQNQPSEAKDIGFFALPAEKASDTQATIWQPNALYIPKTTTGDKLAAAKKFIAFVSSSKTGCKLQNELATPTGPFVNSACKLTGEVLPAVQDVQKYFTEKKTASALEFDSPIKGPNLPNITVQVGSGISTAAQGAALYDQDVKKQAQQLGLKGW